MIEVLRLLHEMEQGSSRYSTTYYCRHLYKHEPIPDFGHGIPDTPLANREWIWVAYSYSTDEPLAILLASPMHNVAMLLRAYAINKAPKSVWLGLFRKALADILARGYTKYSVFLDMDNVICRKLHSIAIKAGAVEVQGNHVFVTGPTDVGSL